MNGNPSDESHVDSSVANGIVSSGANNFVSSDASRFAQAGIVKPASDDTSNSASSEVSDFTAQLRALLAKTHLGASFVESTVGEIMDGALSPTIASAWLALMSAKGESADELFGAARAMRMRAVAVPHRRALVLDVCGTGGDGHHSINISTIVAFVAAACGVAVAKHGNRSASSRCGSADVLEALQINIAQDPQIAAAALDRGDVAFLFAQSYHPAMRAVAPLRRELGIRTIFNSLGPLTNPARATHQLIGVADRAAMERIGETAMRLGARRVAVVRADNGLDEIAGEGTTEMLLYEGESVTHTVIDPAHYGIHATLADIRGGGATENAAAVRSIVAGERSPRADVVALNAAAALLVSGTVDSLKAGLLRARRALEDGSAASKIENMRRGIVPAPASLEVHGDHGRPA